MEAESTLLVNTKSIHLDVLLDEVERIGRVWFKVCLIQGLKVGKMLKMAQVTIIICHLNLNFPLI
jgi:hypothetical protein